MNITEAIGKEIGLGVSVFLSKTPEIQIYANQSINKYQWKDGRFKGTYNVWENESYNTRAEMKTALMEYLKTNGDLD